MMKLLAGSPSFLIISFICMFAVETNACCNQNGALRRMEKKVDRIIAALTKQGCKIAIPGGETKPAKIPTSCEQIKTNRPQSVSGMYTISDANGNNKRQVYCDFNTHCGDKGGWTRVGFLNMQDKSQTCPSGYKLFTSGSTRACSPLKGNAFSGCSASVKFSSNGLKYTKVCGRVTGYQIGVMWGIRGSSFTINSAYVDGISLTYGNPRKHLWSFINSEIDTKNDINYACPCATGSKKKTQSFVGTHYFCESARTTGSSNKATLFHPEPLWDGKRCLLKEVPCCHAAGIPWFNRVLPTPTADDIELRICKHWSGYGHPMFGDYEIYVK